MASQWSREPWRRQLVRDLGKERALGSRHHGEGARGGRAQRGEARGPALPPGKGGVAGERRGPRASPGAVIGQGSVGPRRAAGPGHPHPGSPPVPWTPTSRGPCSIVSVVTSSIKSCLGRQCCSVRGDSLCPRNLGSGPRSHLSCLLQSLAGPSSTRSMSCKATQKAGRRGPGRRRLTDGPALSRRCTLRTSTSITGTAGRSTGTAHVQGGSRCCIWGLRLFRSIRFHL